MTVHHHRIGRVMGPRNEATAEFLLDQARAALHQAKRFIARAENERAGVSNRARGYLGLAIVELEKVAGPCIADEEE